MADRLVTLRDGRRLGVTAFGDPVAQRIVVFCHPAPGAGGFDPDPAVTSSWGVHVVSPDRPGYGSSTPLPEARRPTNGRWADDLAEYIEFVVELARETGVAPVHQVGVVGWAAGGRVALALAARHPGLVDRVAIVATPAPDAAVRWIQPELAQLTADLRELPVPVAKQRLRATLQAQKDVAGVDLLAHGEADLALLERPGLRGRLQRMQQHAYDQGTVGLADDLLASADEDWGFDLEAVHAPVLLVYGARDTVVPSAHGRWYRAQLRRASATLTVVPRAGHLVIAPAWERILQHVDPSHGARSDP
ncbi:alpha/beta fold hydrolase [uncultured Amnibacterium sp.]|uniref:alpha/beta fold hydrolase n=1 Tax=uncultured Amnibacterium sp. TaxID=1631851 RepID=UPI0035CC738B